MIVLIFSCYTPKFSVSSMSFTFFFSRADITERYIPQDQSQTWNHHYTWNQKHYLVTGGRKQPKQVWFFQPLHLDLTVLWLVFTQITKWDWIKVERVSGKGIDSMRKFLILIPLWKCSIWSMKFEIEISIEISIMNKVVLILMVQRALFLKFGSIKKNSFLYLFIPP